MLWLEGRRAMKSRSGVFWEDQSQLVMSPLLVKDSTSKGWMRVLLEEEERGGWRNWNDKVNSRLRCGKARRFAGTVSTETANDKDGWNSIQYAPSGSLQIKWRREIGFLTNGSLVPAGPGSMAKKSTECPLNNAPSHQPVPTQIPAQNPVGTELRAFLISPGSLCRSGHGLYVLYP